MAKCPVCGKPAPAPRSVNPALPFCSERCKLIDFGSWANEEYAVPAEETPPPLEELDQSRAADGDTRRANS